MSNYNRIRDLREDRGKTQKETSEEFYMHLTQYRRYEKGESEIPLCLAIRMADYYNVSLDYLAGRTNDKGGLHCNYLDPEQKKLLNAWEQLSSRQKSIVMANIEEFIEREPRKEERKSAI